MVFTQIMFQPIAGSELYTRELISAQSSLNLTFAEHPYGSNRQEVFGKSLAVCSSW